jgi:L-lysine 6-transaminase
VYSSGLPFGHGKDIPLMIRPEDVHATMKSNTIGDGESIVVDFERSQGTHMVDAITGESYLDLASQFASMPLGWNHPKLNERCTDIGKYAAHKIANSDFYSVPLAEFVHTFAGIAPQFRHFFFVEGGTLGVENALKAAFDWKLKKDGLGEDHASDLDVIHLEQAFHGRSGYTLSLTNTVPNKTALFPKFPWSRIKNPKIHFPLVDSEATKVEESSLAQAEVALQTNRVAAIILETIQGEGGDNHFSPDYFAALRELADKYEAMLILDEVQAGVGLTGKMWAFEHFGIIPDMIAFGKKTQVCGFASTTRIDEVPDNVFNQSSRINSTWGGNIIDMMRFTQIARIINEDKLLDQVSIVGDYFLKQLYGVPRITNVRGRGLMLAFDLETPEARNTVLTNMQKKMTVLPCGERSIRLRPHLIFSMADVDEAIDIIKHAV